MIPARLRCNIPLQSVSTVPTPWFHATGRDPIRVFYDEFTVSRAATIGRVLDALGVDPPEPEGKKPLKRQADDLSTDWVARFRADSERRQRI